VGDQLVIRGWGSIDLEVRTAIDRNGSVNIPKVGAVPLAGVKAAQAESVLRQAVAKYYKDFQISVTLAGLRGITVYVVGQARRPGSYTLSGVSTLASGLLATGGPGPNGSMRRVQLKRAGVVLREFDLYAFLAKGDNSGDIKLTDGDVIVIPPALGHVALVGKVNNPAVFELKRSDETLAEILDVAGGLPVVADPRRVTLERIQPEKSQPRSVLDFALNDAGHKTPLKNGDLITIQQVLPELGNAVTLRGNVAQPQRMAWREGMRIRDLIPNRQDLISRDSVRRQNEALFDSAQRERAQRDRSAVPEDLQSDAQLDQKLLRANRLSGQGAWGLQDQSSGQAAASLGAVSYTDTIGNLYDEINWDYAVIERIQRTDLSVELIPFNLGAVMADPKHADNRLLQAGDIVTVFSANDIRVPLDKRRVMVRVEGEVAHPGIYPAKPHETLLELIAKAGGITPNAYVFGTGFYREEVRKSQTENQAKLIRRLEAETSTALASLSQSQGASSDAALAQARIAAAQQARAQAIERVRSLKPEGRVALGLIPTVDNADLKLPDLRLQNGDRLVVPPKPDFVYVYGSVNTESSLIYRSGATVSDYLQQAGTGAVADRNNIIVVRADGTALTADSGWFSRSIMNTKLMPGDAIVVTDKIDLEATWSAVVRNTKDFTQIFYQLGLGAAAIKTLKN
jgi:protein involved in polysaccharide export with SLBB domain